MDYIEILSRFIIIVAAIAAIVLLAAGVLILWKPVLLLYGAGAVCVINGGVALVKFIRAARIPAGRKLSSNN